MPMKPKTPAQVAAEKKVAVERAKVNAQKNAANKAKVAANAAKVNANKAKPSTSTGTKTVTGKTVTVKAPAMKTVTGQSVTVTGKKPATKKPNEGAIYLVKVGNKNKQVEKAEYDRFKGPKDQMQRDASGYITQKGSGGKRVNIDYEPLKGWGKW